MDFYSLIADTAWFTVVGGIIGGVLTYMANKSTNNKDISINDRQQLSKDQYQLIAELRTMLQEQGDELEVLRKEVRELQQVNIVTLVENKELQFKVATLTSKLNDFENRNEE